jgi:hypothetical protein
MSHTTEMTRLVNEILAVTMKINREFPEVYKHLIESPLFGHNKKNAPDLIDFEEYLNTIQSLLDKMTNLSHYSECQDIPAHDCCCKS